MRWKAQSDTKFTRLLASLPRNNGGFLEQLSFQHRDSFFEQTSYSGRVGYNHLVFVIMFMYCRSRPPRHVLEKKKSRRRKEGIAHKSQRFEGGREKRRRDRSCCFRVARVHAALIDNIRSPVVWNVPGFIPWGHGLDAHVQFGTIPAAHCDARRTWTSSTGGGFVGRAVDKPTLH